jgi:hypothetical protein
MSNDLSSSSSSNVTRALQRFAAASIGASVAELTSLPIDICKVRLQLQKPMSNGQLKYRNMFHCGMRVAREEGANALWKGATAGLTRQISYTGLSLVIYEPIRNFVAGNTPLEDLNFIWRLAAGGTAGAVSIAMVNPTDVIKTQMQSTVGKPKMLPIIQKIWSKEGIKGFWSGVQPNIARCFIGNACELGAYDQAKTWLINTVSVSDGPIAHIGASTFAGFVSAVASCPVDVVRTRLFNQAGNIQQEYKSMIDAFINIPRREGFTALYKGFFPLFIRKVSWTVLFFLSYEQAKRGVGYVEN